MKVNFEISVPNGDYCWANNNSQTCRWYTDTMSIGLTCCVLGFNNKYINDRVKNIVGYEKGPMCKRLNQV